MSAPPLEPGQIVRNRMLGTDATYRIVEQRGENVLVEVIEAPGLEPGYRFEMLAEAAARMERIDDA
jgi:hypothetical protein